jgi:hypothetical protein
VIGSSATCLEICQEAVSLWIDERRAQIWEEQSVCVGVNVYRQAAEELAYSSLWDCKYNCTCYSKPHSPRTSENSQSKKEICDFSQMPLRSNSGTTTVLKVIPHIALITRKALF